MYQARMMSYIRQVFNDSEIKKVAFLCYDVQRLSVNLTTLNMERQVDQ